MGVVLQDPGVWALAALTVLALLFLLLILWAARVGDDGAAPAGGQAESARATAAAREALKRSFDKLFSQLRQVLPSVKLRAALPLVVVLRDRQAAGKLPWSHSGLHYMLSPLSTRTASGTDIEWHLFDQGAVVDLALSTVAPDDPKSQGSRLWEDFLSLARRHRPDRPIDSLVLQVPAALLLRQDAEGLQAITEQAHALHHRLWTVQKHLALRVPVYILISDAQVLPGFAALAGALPQEVSRRMLGWSTTGEATATFQPAWVEAAVAAMASTAMSMVDEAAATTGATDAQAMFLLPSEIERLRNGLHRLTDELFKDSAYHEPFMLRGMYLCGDSSPELQWAQAAAPEGQRPAGDMGAEGVEGSASPRSEPALLAPQPVFLRDLLECKVFPEWGQLRTVKSQPMRQPGAHLALRLTMFALPAIWIVGLVTAIVRVDSSVGNHLVALSRIEDNASLQGASGEGRGPGGGLNLQDLAAILKVEPTRLGSFFMPGSWSVFDGLRERVQDRIDSGIAAGSFDPVVRALTKQMASLTGVALDESSGQLIAGATCTLPYGWRSTIERAGSGGITVEDTREFKALLEYVASLERIDQALLAFRRLRDDNSAPNPVDYRLLASSVGVIVPEASERMASVFRRIARQRKDISLPQLEAAAACSFNLAVKELKRELFLENDLVQSEQELNGLVAKVDTHSSVTNSLESQVQVWSDMLEVLRQQEGLMLPGKGRWMKGSGEGLGVAYEEMLRRVSAVSLLGPALATDTRVQAEEALQRFRSEWSRSMADYTEELGSLQWSDQDNRWMWSAERVGLRTALNTLLNLQFMTVRTPAGYPEIPAQASVAWDKTRLDQALALADARRKVQAEVLPQIPKGFRDEVERLSNAALANSIVDLVARAMILAPRGSPAATFGENERSRLLKVNALLTELGAKAEAERLAGTLARDSLARLRAVDEALKRSDLYTPTDKGIKNWSGERAPYWTAFGVQDAAGMVAYLAQQYGRLEMLAREAEPNLAIVEAAAPQNPLTQRWQGILADLERYRLKSPNSNLATLEQFLTTGSQDIDRINCADRLGKPVARRGADLFTERLFQLQQGLLTRCRELKLTELADHWGAFSGAFNATLAGRAPFSSPAPTRSGDNTALPAQRLPADPEDVGQVLRLFEKARRSLLDKAVEAPSGAGSTKAQQALAGLRRFDEQMERVRAFLMPLFPLEEGTPAGLDLVPEFRASGGAELEGNKIIDWSMTVGSQTLRLRDAPKTLRWEPGTPLTLTLRLAQNSPVVPMADVAQPGMSVQDRTVTYRYADPWALLSFIQRQREVDANLRPDPRAPLLKFEFPLAAAAPEGGKPPTAATEGRARVYLRLTVMPAGKRQALIWPGLFPPSAPDWAAP